MTVWLHDCRLDAIMTWELLNICFCRFWTPKILSLSIFGIQQTVSEQNGVVFGFFCWCCEYGKSEFSLCFNEHRKQKKKIRNIETAWFTPFLFLNRWFGCSFGKKKSLKLHYCRGETPTTIPKLWHWVVFVFVKWFRLCMFLYLAYIGKLFTSSNDECLSRGHRHIVFIAAKWVRVRIWQIELGKATDTLWNWWILFENKTK